MHEELQVNQSTDQYLYTKQDISENQFLQSENVQNLAKQDPSPMLEDLIDKNQSISKENQIILAQTKSDKNSQQGQNVQDQMNNQEQKTAAQNNYQQQDQEINKPQTQNDSPQKRADQAQDNIPNQKFNQSETKDILQKNTFIETKSQEKPTKKQQEAVEQPKVNRYEQIINQGIKYKNEGNFYFKNKDYIQAVTKYQEALRVLNPSLFQGATHAQCLKMAQVSSNLLNNLGTCFYNGQDWRRAQIYYTQAITINPQYVKALLKRAIARNNLQKHQEALEDIKLAYSLDKSNTQICDAYRKIAEDYKIATKKDRQAQKNLTAKMFRSQSQKTDSPSKNITQTLPRQEDSKNKDSQSQPSDIWNIVGGVTALGMLGYGLYRMFSK